MTRYNRLERKGLHGAEIYLVAALLIFGICAVLLLPISGGYDEETHLFRVWEMSAFTFLPNEKLDGEMPFPAVYWELSYRRQPIVRVVDVELLKSYADLSLDAHDYIYGNIGTRSIYSPPLLLPQALVMRYLGRSLDWPALRVYYACRLTGLLAFLLLAWLAVRSTPSGKWVFAILATSPVAVLQAATISADAISNGIALLFIGATLAIAQREEIRWKEWWALIALFFILYWGKVNIVPLALLPFLVIRPAKFQMRAGYISLLVVAIFLCCVEVLGWNLLAYSRFHTALEGASASGQIRFILANPLEFLKIFANNLWTKGDDYLYDWIAIYGFAYWPVPVITYILYAAGLLAALVAREKTVEFSSRRRLGLMVVFVIAYITTILSLYISFTPVGSKVVEGVQGRYFTALMPLLFLALARLPLLKFLRLSPVLPVALSAGSLLVFVSGMYLAYYVPCGSQYYRTGLCYQPNYKNWSPNDSYSPPVSDSLTLRQEIVPECDGMSEVRVWSNAVQADPNGTTEFILRDVAMERDLVRVQVKNSVLPAGDWYTLKFKPDWESSGKLYHLIVSGKVGNGTGPKIAYSLRPEYPAGKLYENEQALAKDILFQTGCVAGLEKLRLSTTP